MEAIQLGVIFHVKKGNFTITITILWIREAWAIIILILRCLAPLEFCRRMIDFREINSDRIKMQLNIVRVVGCHSPLL